MTVQNSTACVGCNHQITQPHTHTHTRTHTEKQKQNYKVDREMYVGAPSKLIAVRLEHVGDDLIAVTSPCLLHITLEPVDEPPVLLQHCERTAGGGLSCRPRAWCFLYPTGMHSTHNTQLYAGPSSQPSGCSHWPALLGPMPTWTEPGPPMCPATAGVLLGYG